MERKFHGSESSLYGLFAPGNESAEERKGLESWNVSISRQYERYTGPESWEGPTHWWSQGLKSWGGGPPGPLVVAPMPM